MKDINYAFKSLKLLLSKYPIIIVGQVIETICNVILALIPIYIVNEIVSGYEKSIEVNDVINKIIIYLALMLGSTIIALIIGFLMSYVDRNFKVFIATSLYKKLDSIDYDFHENTKFLNNFTRALEYGPDRIYNTAIHQLALIRIIFQSLGVFAVIFEIHPLTVAYAFVIGLIYIFIKRKVANINYRFRTQQQPLMRRRWYYNRVFYLKDAMADLKTTEVEGLLLNSHEKLGEGLVQIHNKFTIKRFFLESTGSILIASIYPVVLGIVAYLTLEDLEIASFASLTVAATTLSNLVSRFVNTITNIETEMVECSVPFKVLAMDSTIEGTKGSDIKDEFRELKVSDMSFAYTDKNILNNINFEVKKGQKIAIVGSNGAGKTTLVKLLLRLYDVSTGSINLNGIDYTKISTSSLRKKVGAVFQNPEVYSVTIAENVLLKRIETQEDKQLVIEALKFSGLYDYVNSLEEGMNTLVTREFHRKGQIFSGGQTQKLAIARGYAQNYELFILDEPSSALDPIAEADLYHNMLELGRDKTIIFISHRLSTTVNADYIYLFEDGKVVEAGRHDELMAKGGRYKEMFISQSEKYLGGESDE